MSVVAGRCRRVGRALLGAGLLGVVPVLRAQAPPAPERFPGVTATRKVVTVPAGYQVQAYLTRPAGALGRLPAVLFVQWLSCDPVSVPASGGDGWAVMLRRLITRSGMLVARTEKPGLGESGGPRCDQLGYQEELAAHRAALQALWQDPAVDTTRVFLLGASMGGTMVPFLAAERKVAGVIVWGSTGLSWLEHMIRLDRRVMELRGTPATEVTGRMRDQVRLHAAYLGEDRSPAELARSDSTLARAWAATIGTSPGDQYGRPFRFHQEAEAADWEAAWARVTAQVLVVRGANDFLMSEEEHRRIVAIVNRNGGGRGTFRTLPGLDHNFALTRSEAESLQGKGSGSNLAAPDLFIAWMRAR